MSDSESSNREERPSSSSELPEVEFRRATKEEFMAAQAQAVRAIAERPPLTEQEKEAGWEESPSGLRINRITGEIDDSLFVHIGPSSGR
jgi:hypothetical protein